MAEAGSLLLSQVIGAFSYALDLTEGQPPGHCVRCCWIGSHIGRQLGLDDGAQWDLYYTLLLKDAGCSSNAARLCQLYESDDRLLKRDFKLVNDDRAGQMLRFVVSHTGLQRGLTKKLSTLLNLARTGEQAAKEMIQTRCERGAAIARQLGFNERVARGIHSLDEHWNGDGRPEGLRGEQIALGSRIALLAQVVDVFHFAGGPRAALDEIQARSGTWFDPELVRVFEAVTREESFWSGLQAADIEQRVLALEPAAKVVEASEEQLDAIAAAFGQVVDAKSPYTAGHSERVAHYVDVLAQRLGLSAARRRWLRRGALLHDLGKLGVSNAILDKPGKLTDAEWQEVRRHPAYTEQILQRIPPLERLAFVAGAHHERLDGKGYPRGLAAADIPLETRIITIADIFDALTAERPYRGPMPAPQALEIMQRMVGTALDAQVFELLRQRVDELLPPAAETAAPTDRRPSPQPA